MRKIELINLTLDEIRKASTMINEVMNETIHYSIKEDNEVLKERANSMSILLEDTRLNLRQILEALHNYQDSVDMLCLVDVALSKVAFDLIYERKDEFDFAEGKTMDDRQTDRVKQSGCVFEIIR